MAASHIEGPTPPARLLVVEDEAHLAAGLQLNFELEGFHVDVAGNARDASALLTGEPYDVIVLDVMLPDTDGFELCRRMRKVGNFTPVIMLTARSRPEDRVQGIDAGADDYLPKPFELDELLARVRSLIRRRAWERDQKIEPHAGEIVQVGEVKINFATHEAWLRDEPLRLTSLEYDLVAYFLANPKRVISREELMENVWKLRNYPNTRTVDNFIVRLRKYFEADAARPTFFLSVRGAGYKFVPGVVTDGCHALGS